MSIQIFRRNFVNDFSNGDIRKIGISQTVGNDIMAQ
jgi:hypothetical protein